MKLTVGKVLLRCIKRQGLTVNENKSKVMMLGRENGLIYEVYEHGM